MKRKDQQPGLFDAQEYPLWFQDAAQSARELEPDPGGIAAKVAEVEGEGKPSKAPSAPHQPWHTFGSCGSNSLPCPRCKGEDTRKRCARIADWIAGRAAALVNVRGISQAEARARAEIEFWTMEDEEAERGDH